jgi:hypothetical protein
MRGGVLAGMYGLHSQLKRVSRDTAAVFDTGIDEADDTAITILGTHQMAGSDQAFVTIFPSPEKRFYVRSRLRRNAQADSPEAIQRFFRHIAIELLQRIIGGHPETIFIVV